LPAQPASRYSVGCADLAPTTSMTPLFSHVVKATDPGANWRRELYPQLPQTYFIAQQGGIDCLWDDGKDLATTGQAAYLSVLPESTTRWNYFITSEGKAVGATSYTYCTPADASGDPSSCEYDALVDGSWLYIDFENMVPKPSNNPGVLPTPVKNLVTAATAALVAAGPPAPPASPQAPDVVLPKPGAILTGAAVKAAIGTSGAVTLDCSGVPDGPWSPGNEAELQTDASLGCAFGAGSTGGTYGFLYWLGGGEWAERQAVAATPSETALSIPGLPAGDSAAEFKNDEREPVVDLLIGGNWIEISLSTGDDLEGLPVETVSPEKALVTLAQDIEKTVRRS
jgi:hypothetical protein